LKDARKPVVGWGSSIRYTLGIALLLLGGFAAGYWTGRGHASLQLPDLGTAPRYDLMNQLGRKVSSESFADKVEVVTFLFPYCTTYCPLITAHLIGFGRLVAREGVEDRVSIVAFNLAPDAAGPAQMREFLKQYGWDPHDPLWQFLTGTEAKIRKVVTDGFHVTYQRVSGQDKDAGLSGGAGLAPQLDVSNPLAEKAKPGFDIVHNDVMLIVDRQGRVRKIYDNADTVSDDRLWDDIQPLVRK
jgi:protein SCO1/2